MQAPAAKRNVLVLLAGLLWSAVGAVLITVGCVWVYTYSGNWLLSLAIGITLGYGMYRFQFVKLAKKNLTRIHAQAPGKEKVCLFAFQDKRSYFIVVIMMSMGYGLRHSPIPKIYLAPFYIAIGSALLLSSFHYYLSLRDIG